jgi:hypothetical protein
VEIRAEISDRSGEEIQLRLSACVVGVLALAGIASVACTTNTHVTLSNPTSGPLLVQVNERAAVKIAAGGSARVTLPALERLQPLSITARDERGAIVYSTSLTWTILRAAGNRVSLDPVAARAYDPLVAQR